VDKTMHKGMLFEVEDEDATILIDVGNANASDTP
jgi:hypothetical protein